MVYGLWFMAYGLGFRVEGLPLVDVRHEVHDRRPEHRRLFQGSDRLRVGWLNGFSFITSTGAEQKMLKGHLPRVVYHQVY